MIFSKTKYILVGMLALSVTVAGAGYSFFAFSEDDSASESVDPSADNIRENFIFGDPAADSNVFDTKYYTVRFYAQYCGRNSVGDGPEKHYQVTGGNSVSGYSHYFGYFRNSNVELINELGGTVTSLTDASGSFYNCITFRNISMITQEMVQAVGVPLCSDGGGTGVSDEGLVDKYNFLIHFLSWLLIDEGASDVPDFYAGYSWNQESDKCTVTGTYPFEGYEIPNFNLALETYDHYADNGVINFYPYLSAGKEYRDGYPTKNSIKFSTDADPDSYNLPPVDHFVYDPSHSDLDKGIEAYRLPGLTINAPSSGNPDDYPDFNEATSVLMVDINRSHVGSNWLGAWMGIPSNGNSTYVNNDEGDKQSYTGTAYNLADLSLPVGRYNLYLFLVQSKFTELYDFSWDDPGPDNVVCNATVSPENVNKILSDLNIRQYKAVDLGFSFVYDNERTWSIPPWELIADVCDFYLVVEKTFDVKLLGGETGTLIYDEAPYSPSFNQIVSSSGGILNEFEVRDVTMDASRTFTYDLSGFGTIVLPQTFFSIGIDQNRPRFTLTPVVLTYSDSAIGPGSDPTNADEEDVPVVIAKYSSFDGSSVVTEERPEHYFSKSYGSDGQLNADWSLLTLSEWCASNPGSMEVSYIPEGGNEAMSLASAYSQNAELREMIDQMPIFKVPSTGEYNFYLRFHYSPESGVVNSLQIDLYFYRIHNIFVKIASDSSWENGLGYVNTGSEDFTFYTSSQSYFLLDTLGLDDHFITNEGSITLGAIMNRRQGTLSSDEQATTAWILYDVVSGQYALPTALENGEFVIKKNHVLAWKRVNRSDVGWSNADDQLLAAYA